MSKEDKKFLVQMIVGMIILAAMYVFVYIHSGPPIK